MKQPVRTTNEPILAINSGSSSLKIGLFQRTETKEEECVFTGLAEGIGTTHARMSVRNYAGELLAERACTATSQADALSELIEISPQSVGVGMVAVGHRIVHGGPRLLSHALIDAELLSELDRATHFAPLHIPTSIELIRKAQALFPGVPQFACFDTAFHRHLPEVARRLPLPIRYDALGIQRYGFHGLSYESILRRLNSDVPERSVFAHLGSGSSLCALYWGRPVYTSMSFTPTGGIPMSTRCGDLDPGVLLFLMRNEGLGADELEDLLNHQSGLSGLSGGEADMRRLLKREAAGDKQAQLAIEAYVRSIRMTIGSYAALLGGLDLLVITGGIGEHSEEIRSRICHRMGFVHLSEDTCCSHVAVMPTEEERQIAMICRSLQSSLNVPQPEADLSYAAGHKG